MRIATLWLIVAVICHHVCCAKRLFRKNDTLAVHCKSTETVNAKSNIGCGVKCTSLKDKACIAYGYKNNKCELCTACPEPTSQQFNPSGVVFHATADLQKDLVIHVPMESIINDTIPAVGAVYGTTGPYTTPGKFGKAIYLPNAGTSDDNVIKIVAPPNHCLERIYDCQNGATFSLWFKVPAQSHEWPNMILSTSIKMFFRQTSGQLKFITGLDIDATYTQSCNSFPPVTYNVWHHVGFTYHPKSGIDVYYDGCKHDMSLCTLAARNLGPHPFEFGCNTVNGNVCTKVHLDDLRIWNVKKDETFMYLLAKM